MIKRLGVVAVLLVAVVTLADAQPKPVRPFTFILDFLPYGEYTPYFTALDKGWKSRMKVKGRSGFGCASARVTTATSRTATTPSRLITANLLRLSVSSGVAGDASASLNGQATL